MKKLYKQKKKKLQNTKQQAKRKESNEQKFTFFVLFNGFVWKLIGNE